MSTYKLNLCRKCDADISSIDLTKNVRCPNCNTKLEIAKNKFYKSPDYISRQKSSLLKELELGKLKPGDSKYDSEHAEICNQLVKWARECPDEDKLMVMMDAEVVLRELMHSESSGTTMSAIVNSAKRLSKLANIIEQYFREGGSPYDREIRLISPQLRDDVDNKRDIDEGWGS